MTTIKTLALGILGSVLAAPILWLIVKILDPKLDEVLIQLIQATSTRSISIILLVTLSLVVLLMTYTYILQSKLTKLKEAFNEKAENKNTKQPTLKFTIKNGVYYDKNNNAFCPTCKSLMTHQLPAVYDENYWWCDSCKKFYAINPSAKDKEIMTPF